MKLVNCQITKLQESKMDKIKTETPTNRYVRKNMIRIMVNCNRKTEPELVEKINSVGNKNGYIKELIKIDTETIKKYIKKEKPRMKQQWIDFLEKNESSWSYGIVPSLVNALDSACKNNDTEKIKEILESLATQGVKLENGNLKFLFEINI